jgi:hypothetical protein
MIPGGTLQATSGAGRSSMMSMLLVVAANMVSVHTSAFSFLPMHPFGGAARKGTGARRRNQMVRLQPLSNSKWDVILDDDEVRCDGSRT